jgi:signal peptidase I
MDPDRHWDDTPPAPPFIYTVPLLTDMQHSQPIARAPYRWLRFVLREMAHLAIIILILYMLINLMIPRFVVEGNSMEPNFHDHERIIVSRLDYILGSPQRGHVIVFRHEAGTYLIKRIVGLPGEQVELHDGKVYIDGTPLTENYVSGLCETFSCRNQIWTLDDDQYFVLGDNRNSSLDSHQFGPIRGDQIVGRVRMRYWPLEEMNLFGEYQNY